MKKSDILDKLGKKEIKAEDITEKIIKNPDFLPEIFNGISSENPRVKFKSAKILRIISEKDPKKLYSKIDFFINLLDSENNIIKWNAMDIIANLTLIDSENKFDEIFKKYYGLLSDESMITAGHVVDNSAKIVKAKPYLQDKITTELLKIESIPREQECKNILLGKVILSFGQYIDQVKNKEKMISLAKRQLNNTRNATKVKAEKFLKIVE
ncbi:MAG: hypothetical protein ACE5WD_14915 [Candidatus Aminicenantia bacterium]